MCLQVLTDGLLRKEVDFPVYHVRLAPAAADSAPLPCYVVSRKIALQTQNVSVLVLLPDVAQGWRDKGLRVLADELAFLSSAVVLVPDIYRNSSVLSSRSSATPQGSTQHLSDAAVFDCTVSTLLFASTEYATRSLAVGGVGHGAGRALAVTCDLYDIACIAEQKELVSLVGDPALLQDLSTNTVAAAAAQQIHKRCNIFRRPPALPTADPSAFAKGLTRNVKLDAELLMQEYLATTRRRAERTSGEQSSDAEDLSSADRSKAAAEAAAEKRNSVQAVALQHEVDVVCRAAASAPASLVHERSSLSVAVLAGLLPTAVLAIHPQEFDAERVGERMIAPTLFVFGGGEQSGDSNG